MDITYVSDGEHEDEPVHKRARLSSPHAGPSSRALADPSIISFLDEEDLKTPERDVGSPSNETTRVKHEESQHWVELALQQGPPSASPSPPPHPSDPQQEPTGQVNNGEAIQADLERAQSAAGSASGGHEQSRSPTPALAEAQSNSETLFPKFQRGTSNTWSSDSEIALARFIARESVLRDWTNNGGERSVVMPFLQHFSTLTRGPSSNAIRNKIIRMDEAYHIFRQQLSADAKDARVASWSNDKDLELLAGSKAQHGSTWMRIWHDHVWLNLPIDERMPSPEPPADRSPEPALRTLPPRAARARSCAPHVPTLVSNSSQVPQTPSSKRFKAAASRTSRSRSRARSVAPSTDAEEATAGSSRSKAQGDDVNAKLDQQQQQISQLQSQIERQGQVLANYGQMIADQTKLQRHHTKLLHEVKEELKSFRGVNEKLDAIAALLEAE